MELSIPIVAILLASGLVVGFINTLAGGGSAISLTVFMALGLPMQVANGTNRIAILMQNLSSTATFFGKRMLDARLGVRLALPVIAGTLIGARVAITIDERVFQVCLAAVMVSVLAFILLGDRVFRRGGHATGRVGPLHYLLFFVIGLYNGYIYVGTGYLILLVSMGMMHLNMVHANVAKNFVILLAIPFSLFVFMMNGHVNYAYGLVHGAGNMVGAFLASHYAIGWGARFLRWFTVAVVLACLADVVGLVSVRSLVMAIIGRGA